MTSLSRLLANILLPVLLFCSGYILFYWLGMGLLEEISLQTIVISLSILLAVIPPIAFRFIIHSQLKEGFALLKNGKIVLNNEITLSHVLGHRITAWKLYQQHIDTEVCLQGNNELVYVQLGLDFQIPANERGKRFIKHFKNNMTVFEAWVQRAIFVASGIDKELARGLATNALMNEEDELTLRSKFLSALEAQPLKSVELPVNTAGLNVNREVRVKKKHIPPPHPDQEDNALNLNSELLSELGLSDPS